MEQSNQNVTDIDLKEVDWRNLDMEGFQKLSQKISERNKLHKSTQERKKRIVVEEQLITIKGVSFNLPSNLVLRLKQLKDGKPKEKLIDEIFNKYTPIEVL